MNNIILFDDDTWKSLLPLTYTRPISELRVGILTIREKWELYLKGEASYITQDYLSDKYPIKITSDNYVVNSSLLPSEGINTLIRNLDKNEALLYDDVLLAARLNSEQFQKLIDDQDLDELKGLDLSNKMEELSLIKRPHDIFRYNGQEICKDFKLISSNKFSKAIPENCRVLNEKDVFIEADVKMNFVTLNAEDGPIYIGKNANIMEGALIRGPFAIGAHGIIKMGAKIYGSTTIGPYSKVGGELNNCVFQGNSSKSHDGYMGNSVIGEWCNIGADTNCSNLSNNYTEVKTWDYTNENFTPTGLLFCGLVMGDHSKTAINTMFNTGTIVGVNCNIFGEGFPRTFIPSYSWGGHTGYKTYTFSKSLATAEIVMGRRKQELTDKDKTILEHIFHASSKFRTWES